MAGPSEQAVACSYIDRCPAGQPRAWRQGGRFRSAHPGNPRLGHVEGVTKPKQAERANGVHTEVSVRRQGPPPVRRPLSSPAITPARSCSSCHSEGSVIRGGEHMTLFRLGTHGTSDLHGPAFVPRSLPCHSRRCTYRGVPY